MPELLWQLSTLMLVVLLVVAEILGRTKRKSSLECYGKFGLWHLSRKICGIQDPQGAWCSIGQRARGAEEHDLLSILRHGHCLLAH